MKSPNFFIIGAPKCGTTALASWLAEHPHVFMSPVKEPHYYNTDLRRTITSEVEYQRLFAGAKGQHIAVGEASVLYLYSAEAVPQVLSDAPDARFVVMLRNPVEMAPSLHEQLYFTFNEDVEDFRAAWYLQQDRASGNQLPKASTEPALLQYGRICGLGCQVKRLLATVPREQCHFILLDDIKNNVEAEWLRLLEFLSVPDDGRESFPTENSAKSRRYPVVARSALALGRLKTRLFGRAFSLGLLNRVNRLTREERARVPLDPGMRAELEAYFHDDVRLLESLLDRDLSCWIPPKEEQEKKRDGSPGERP